VKAKALCLESDIDLLVTDIVMPEMHGVTLIMELIKECPDLSIIAISGVGGVSGRFDYLEIANLLGASNILWKPFEAKQLRDMVHAALKSHHE